MLVAVNAKIDANPMATPSGGQRRNRGRALVGVHRTEFQSSGIR
jgi:hypothetical protein